MSEYEITLKNPPEGFAAEARIGSFKVGDYIIDESGLVVQAKFDSYCKGYTILTPLPAPLKNGDKFTDEHGREWEVGACYFAKEEIVLIEVLSQEVFAKHSSGGGGSFESRRLPCVANWRKVIEPDGTPCDCETLDETAARLEPQKTIREWLQELPEPWRTAAVDQCTFGQFVVGSQGCALQNFCSWDGTKEGHTVWSSLRYAISHNDPLPDYPAHLLKKEKRVERCEVESRDGWLWITAPNGGNYTITDCMNSADFRGCVYRHPNGKEKVFGFCHPIFVRSASESPDWDWSHAETKQHTHMLRPVAVLMEI